jgi:hypothetical protein
MGTLTERKRLTQRRHSETGRETEGMKLSHTHTCWIGTANPTE